MAKKFIVRDGFVVVLKLEQPNGGSTERTYTGGDEVTLEDSQAADHAHKLEFASQKDRDAAYAAEQQAATAATAKGNPVDLVQALASALQQALAAGMQVSAQVPVA